MRKEVHIIADKIEESKNFYTVAESIILEKHQPKS